MKVRISPKNILLTLFVLICSQGCHNTILIEKISDIVIDENGKTINGEYGYNINGLSFQQDLLRSSNGFQYIVYYDAENHLCVSRRRLINNSIETIRFSDYVYSGGNNSHCTVSLGICEQDGTLHLAFDHHNSDLHYKKSVTGLTNYPDMFEWTEKHFSQVQNSLITDTIKRLCYPRFLHHPKGSLQFIYRIGGSGDGMRMLIDYDPQKNVWENLRQIDDGLGHYSDQFGESNSRCSYPNGYTYDLKGILHCSFVWRESSEGANHDFMYVSSKDNGNVWLNNEEDTVGFANTNVNINSPGIKIFDIGRDKSLMNTQAQDVDSEGMLHAVMWYKKEGYSYKDNIWWTPMEAEYVHFYRDKTGLWHRNSLPFSVGNRPSICFDNDDNVYLVYLSNVTSDKWLNRIYFPKGKLVVATARKNDKWKNWKIIYQEEGPFLNEVKIDEPMLKQEGILSLFLQETPSEMGAPSRIRILDLKCKN